MYLYLKLRIYAAQKAGYFNDYKFTKHERYRLLPYLEKAGLLSISENRLFSHRKSTKTGQSNIVYVTVTSEHLASEKSFKGFMIAFAERYLLRLSHRSQAPDEMTSLDVESVISDRDMYQKLAEENGWSFHSKQFVTSIQTIGSRRMTKDKKVLSGIIRREAIAKFLGVSVASVKRWRKESPNIYRYGISTGKVWKIFKNCEAFEVAVTYSKKQPKTGEMFIDYTPNGYFGESEEFKNDITERSVYILAERIDKFNERKLPGWLKLKEGFYYEEFKRVCEVTTMVEVAEPKVRHRNSTCLRRYFSPTEEQKQKRDKDTSKILYGRGKVSNKKLRAIQRVRKSRKVAKAA